jgi:hypothetical protein
VDVAFLSSAVESVSPRNEAIAPYIGCSDIMALTLCSLFVLFAHWKVAQGEIMRKVEIVMEPQVQRCFLAVDVKSGEPILRLHDRELLRRICQSLEWKIVRTSSQRARLS